jgi:hypothetical protein
LPQIAVSGEVATGRAGEVSDRRVTGVVDNIRGINEDLALVRDWESLVSPHNWGKFTECLVVSEGGQFADQRLPAIPNGLARNAQSLRKSILPHWAESKNAVAQDKYVFGVESELTKFVESLLGCRDVESRLVANDAASQQKLAFNTSLWVARLEEIA